VVGLLTRRVEDSRDSERIAIVVEVECCCKGRSSGDGGEELDAAGFEDIL